MTGYWINRLIYDSVKSLARTKVKQIIQEDINNTALTDEEKIVSKKYLIMRISGKSRYFLALPKGKGMESVIWAPENGTRWASAQAAQEFLNGYVNTNKYDGDIEIIEETRKYL